MPDQNAHERAKMFSALPFETLRRARNEAAAQGDLELANDAIRAMELRSRTQNTEIENCGQIFEHVEKPSRENGARFITTYTGDPLAWMQQFMLGPIRCRINREALNAAKRANPK